MNSKEHAHKVLRGRKRLFSGLEVAHVTFFLPYQNVSKAEFKGNGIIYLTKKLLRWQNRIIASQVVGMGLLVVLSWVYNDCSWGEKCNRIIYNTFATCQGNKKLRCIESWELVDKQGKGVLGALKEKIKTFLLSMLVSDKVRNDQT